MRAIDCGELEKRISSLARLARSDAQKSLLGRVLYIVENMPTLTPPNEWVIVGERLPEKKQDVLMLFGAGNMAVGWLYDIDEHTTFWCAYTDDGFYTGCDCAPTHWMPLPKPPKGSEDVAENATTAERCAWHEWIAGRFGDVR